MPIDRIEALLKRAMGLDVASIGRSSVEQAVSRRMAECACASLEAYSSRISSCAAELQELIEAVVVPETWFKRDPGALEAMVRLARTAIEGSATRRIRVLSVPCSTGEEPYSVAISIEEAGLDPERFRIDAVDISRESLVKARRGVYRGRSFRGTHQSFKDRYFDVRADGWEIAERLRRRVRFHHGNLLEATSLPCLGCYDFVFCRNLLIYFDGPTQEKAAAVCARLLSPDGVLFVGPAESSLILSRGFASARIPSAAAFFRVGATPLSGLGEARAPRPRRPPTHAPRATSPAVAPRSIGSSPRPCPAAPMSPADGESPLDTAARLADQGRYTEAGEFCRKHVSQAGPSARAFYLLGMIEDAMNRPDEAQACYRKAIYLEPGHADSLVQLAHHARRVGDGPGAERYHRRARRSRERIAP